MGLLDKINKAVKETGRASKRAGDYILNDENWIVQRNLPKPKSIKQWRKISDARIRARNAPYEKRIDAEVKRLEKRIASLERELSQLEFKIGGWKSQKAFIERKTTLIQEINKVKKQLRSTKDPGKIWYVDR
jgi:chromosome segregation ATPase